MTTTYFTDSTPPAAYTGTYTTAIAGKAAGAVDRMQYALWQDDVTWDAWVSWAKQNSYNDGTNRYENFSSWALSIRGYWSTIGETNLSHMCIGDTESTSYGAVCVEAALSGGAPPTTFASRTFRIAAADVAGKLDTAKDSALDLLDWGFTTTDNSSPALTEVAEDTSSPGNWQSFQVMNCEVTTISLTCTSWVASDAGKADSGYVPWRPGRKAKFYWWDGLDITDSALYPTDSFEKGAVSSVVSLEETYTAAGAAELSVGILSAVAALLVTF